MKLIMENWRVFTEQLAVQPKELIFKIAYTSVYGGLISESEIKVGDIVSKKLENKTTEYEIYLDISTAVEDLAPLDSIFNTIIKNCNTNTRKEGLDSGMYSWEIRESNPDRPKSQTPKFGSYIKEKKSLFCKDYNS